MERAYTEYINIRTICQSNMDSKSDWRNLIKSNRIIRGDEIRDSKSKEISLLLPDGRRNNRCIAWKNY